FRHVIRSGRASRRSGNGGALNKASGRSGCGWVFDREAAAAILPECGDGEDQERDPDEDERDELPSVHRLAKYEDGGQEDERRRDILHEAGGRIADAPDGGGKQNE